MNRWGTSIPNNFQEVSGKNYTGNQKISETTNAVNVSRKINWTARRLKWRELTKEDLYFFSKFIEKTVTNAVPIEWKVRLLNKNLEPKIPIVKKFYRTLNRTKKQPFFYDGINIFSLILNEPHAPLLAEYIA